VANISHDPGVKLLFDHRELLAQAVDELLRHSKLVSSTMPRVATEDVTVGDTTIIRAGEAVIPLIAVANRDSAAFPDPHRFDITRTVPAPHLGLGHGPHYCLGAQLAKLELHIALDALLTRFPDFAPAIPLDQLHWKSGLSVRALHSLPITW
jgi:cytochrome P450